MRAELVEKIADLEAENYDWLQEVDKLLKTIRYLKGIAERGTGTKLPDDQTVDAFVLGYVKSLEAKLAAANCALQESGDRAVTIAQQAEENTRLLQANRDCVDHFEALKEDFDKQAEKLAAAEKALIECRSSVKMDWQNYERLLMENKLTGSRKVIADEANRLHQLLITIDAAIAKTA